MKPFSELPLYLRIADELRSELILLPIGAPFETEQALTERFGVSRGTIRQALDVLVREGILQRTQGSGSFRAQPESSPYRFMLTQELTDSIREIGTNSTVRNLSITLVPAPYAVAELLGIPNGTKVRRVVRTRAVDGKPIAFGTAYLRTDMVPPFHKRDYTASLGELVRTKLAVHIEDRYCNLLVEAADDVTAEALQIPVKSPILKICLFMTGYNGDPLLTDVFCFPSSQVLHFKL